MELFRIVAYDLDVLAESKNIYIFEVKQIDGYIYW